MAGARWMVGGLQGEQQILKMRPAGVASYLIH